MASPIQADAQRLAARLEGVLCLHTVLLLADEQTDGRIIAPLLAKKVVASHHITSQLTHIGKLELTDFYLYHHVTREIEIVEKQVDEVLRFAHLQAVFLAHISEARTQFCKEMSDVV